jgi:hypothetical protein
MKSLLNRIKALFQRPCTAKVPTKETPKLQIGQDYLLTSYKGNPWVSIRVNILAIEDGWVKYCFTDTNSKEYSTLQESTFITIYTKKD